MIEILRVVLPGPRVPVTARGLYATSDVTGSGRHLRLAPGRVVALDTYVNAVPWAAHWAVLSGGSSLVVSCRLDGTGRLRVRSGGAAVARELAAVEAHGSSRVVELHVTVPPGHHWVWLELEAAATGTGLVVDDASFSVPTAATPCALGVGMTTFNRAPECCATLRDLSELSADLVPRVVVVDQSDDPLVEHPDFAGAAAALGDRLTVVRQPNLGGSGGFSRAMVELRRDAPRHSLTHCVLMDDDIVVEPELVRRLGAVAATGVRTILGAQMLDLLHPTVLYASGEEVSRWRFWWSSGPRGLSKQAVDGSVRALPESLATSARVGFTGWWTCMLPVSLIDEVGYALPFFIKWDDAEYCLRAGQAGYPTTMMPGIAVWHMPWTAKDAASDWQTFFLVRNRLVTAALHGPAVPLVLVADILAQLTAHLVRMSYSRADAHVWGLQAFLDGPAGLRDFPGVEAVRNRRRAFDDAVSRPLGDLPPAVTAEVPVPGELSRTAVLRLLVTGTVRAFWPRRETGAGVLRLPDDTASWVAFSRLDAVALVDEARGSAAVRRRDARLAWSLLGRGTAASVDVLLRWNRTRRAYRSEAAWLASADSWAVRWPGERLPSR